MLTINFLPDSDINDYSQSIKEYQAIWNTDGGRIFNALTTLSGCQFRETFINAIVYHAKSMSHPLSLRYSLEPDRKRSAFIHELGHRLLNRFVKKPDTLDRHKFLFLVLYDVFIDLYGENFAKESVEWDSNLGPMYKEAWEFALSFKTKEERQGKFKVLMAE